MESQTKNYYNDTYAYTSEKILYFDQYLFITDSLWDIINFVTLEDFSIRDVFSKNPMMHVFWLMQSLNTSKCKIILIKFVLVDDVLKLIHFVVSCLEWVLGVCSLVRVRNDRSQHGTDQKYTDWWWWWGGCMKIYTLRGGQYLEVGIKD